MHYSQSGVGYLRYQPRTKKRAQYLASFKAQTVRKILKEGKPIPQITAEPASIRVSSGGGMRSPWLANPRLFSNQETQAQAAREAERQRKKHEFYAEIGRAA